MADNIITESKAELFDTASPMFYALRTEYIKLSAKKPEATINKHKVTSLNMVLQDLLSAMDGEPETKYIAIIDDDDLPQYSDIVLMLAQFKAAMSGFYERYHNYKGEWRFEPDPVYKYDDDDEE